MEIFSSFGGKMFYGPPPCLFETNLKYFWVFLVTLMAKLVYFFKVDKVYENPKGSLVCH